MAALAPSFHYPRKWKCLECNTFSGFLEARAHTTSPQTMEIQVSTFEIRVYANKITEGEMSETQVAQATNRKPDIVRKWSQASGVEHQNVVCDELLEKGKV